MKKAVVKDTLRLAAITLIAALLLALVYQLTKDVIAEAEAAERMESFHAVYPEAESFEKIDGNLVSDWNAAHSTNAVIEGYDALDGEGNRTDIVLSVVSHNGYGGDVVLSVGFGPDCTVTNVKVTSMSETSGLGANCTKAEWVAQFSGKNADSISFVKNGNPADDEIDAITGATITTKAVLEAVNNGIAFAKDYFGGEDLK